MARFPGWRRKMAQRALWSRLQAPSQPRRSGIFHAFCKKHVCWQKACLQTGCFCALIDRKSQAMTVIEHDFGLADRLTERRFARLLELDALHEANIRANPLPYLERASERIFRLSEVLHDALAAGKAQPQAEAVESRSLMVDAAEFDRLKKCFAILEAGYAKYGAPDDVT
jgi:hypothetical protein